MDDFNNIVETISLSMGAAWGSGINLYATILVLGLLGMTDNIVLPQGLEILMNPMVIGAAGLMYFVEFFADKIPGVDTGWDTLHTFVRIPAGVLLAAGAVGDVNPAMAVAAGILGGGLATTTHAAKSGSRLMINASPEPVSNWIASLLEDIAVITGVWAALIHPWVFIIILILFIFLMIWFLPKLWEAIKKFFAFLGRIFSGDKRPVLNESKTSNSGEQK
ncbi:MAG: DUF4126 domain-containing protein [Thermodesulfobacteriota bacterium]